MIIEGRCSGEIDEGHIVMGVIGRSLSHRADEWYRSPLVVLRSIDPWPLPPWTLLRSRLCRLCLTIVVGAVLSERRTTRVGRGMKSYVDHGLGISIFAWTKERGARKHLSDIHAISVPAFPSRSGRSDKRQPIDSGHAMRYGDGGGVMVALWPGFDPNERKMCAVLIDLLANSNGSGSTMLTDLSGWKALGEERRLTEETEMGQKCTKTATPTSQGIIPDQMDPLRQPWHYGYPP